MNTKTWWNRAGDGLLELGLALGILLVGLFHVLFPILEVAGLFDQDTSREVRLTGATLSPAIPDGGGLTVLGVDRAEIVLTDPDMTRRLMLALPGIVQGLGILFLLNLLLRMAGALRAGDVFAPSGPRRLHLIGGAVLALGYLVPLVTALTTEALVEGTPATRKVAFTYEASAIPFFVAFLIAALAEAFRRGAKLRADTEGLV